MCDDDDINFGKLGKMQSSVITFERRATWALNQHPDSSDDEVEHETPPQL
jgi:hypothetical protein